MSTWNIALVRTDPATMEELQHDTIWEFEDGINGAPTLGGLQIALAYTTTVVAEPNGEAFDFGMIRNDPYTEDFISRTTILEGFTEDPEAQFPTAPAMAAALRKCIYYIPEVIEVSRAAS